MDINKRVGAQERKRRRLCTKQSMGQSPKGSGLSGAMRTPRKRLLQTTKFQAPHFTWPPWRRKRQPTPVFLPGVSHGQRNLVGYSP